ncbi:MAG: RNA 2',3'-cyclic phosphodiesterase, partial [Desulfosporosinus sp.]
MRLFVGVDLPLEIQQTLLKFQSELRELGVYGSWKSPDNFHITLEFLGEPEFDKLSVLTETLTKVAGNYRRFGLSIGGIGAFPSLKKPHTLWTAVSGSLTELNRLRRELHHELQIKGFKLDERQFKPHITLASRPKLDKVDFSVVQTKIFGEY